MSACCNSVNKSNLQFSGRTFIYKQSVGDLTLNMLSFLKHGRFSITSIRKLLIGGFRKKRNRSNTSTGARPDRKVRFILGELFDTWSWQPNDRKWFWLDGIESCCVGVEGSSKSICVRRFSPSALSLFRFHLSPFPPETPDTLATSEDCNLARCLSVFRNSAFHISSSTKSTGMCFQLPLSIYCKRRKYV